MKRIMFLLFAALLFVGCANDSQSKAEKAVKASLKKSVTAYESVSFGEVQEMDLSTDPEYREIKDSLKFYMDALKETGDQFKLASNQNNAKAMKFAKEDMERFFANKKYKIEHTYKANTSSGVKEEVEKTFYLNAGFVVVE